jgi:SpoIID/LytB domain protein
MCQTGAYGMALEGATFQQILQHYYPGMTLQRVD